MNNSKIPKIFISYSWEGEEHQNWVKKLADDLINQGVDVILDIYETKAGSNMKHWMETAERNADFIVPVFTAKYTSKANHRDGGVGYEYGLIIQTLYENMADNEKIIPILRKYDLDKDSDLDKDLEYMPKFIRQYWYIDFSNDSDYESKLEELLRSIHGEPKHKKPNLGNRPDFD